MPSEMDPAVEKKFKFIATCRWASKQTLCTSFKNRICFKLFGKNNFLPIIGYRINNMCLLFTRYSNNTNIVLNICFKKHYNIKNIAFKYKYLRK